MTYPEHARLSAIEEQADAIRGFLHWLSTVDYYLMRQVETVSGRTVTRLVGKTDEELIADHFGIDLGRLEQERKQMIAAIIGAQKEEGLTDD